MAASVSSAWSSSWTSVKLEDSNVERHVAPLELKYERVRGDGVKCAPKLLENVVLLLLSEHAKMLRDDEGSRVGNLRVRDDIFFDLRRWTQKGE